MRTSELTNEISAALSKAQGEMEAAPKQSDNPAFRGSKYANLASCVSAARPALAKHGLCVVQSPEFKEEGGFVYVVTRISHQSGQWMESETWCRPKSLSPQDVGSAITYLRRYSFSAMVGLITEEDDDGNQASGKGQHNKADERSSSQPQGTQGQDKKSADKSANTQDLVSKILQAFGQYGITRGKLETFLNSTMENMTKDMVDMLRKVLEGGPEMVTSTFGATSKSSAVDKLNEQFSS